MSPELTALARLLGELYHDSGTIVRLVEQAGMDATKLPLSNTTPANAWFAILELAESEGLLPQLIANVRRERPRNVALGAAWQAYVNERRPIADAVPSQALVAQRHREQETLKMEEQNGRMGAIDARVDRLQRDVADLRATVARLETLVSMTVEQNKAILAQLDTHWRHDGAPVTPLTVTSLLLGLMLLAGVVFATVYLGGGG